MSTVQLSNIIAPAFYRVHRAIKTGSHRHIWCKGGRGSTKSSCISIEIVQGMMRDENAHAIVIRKVGNTLRESVFEQVKWAIDVLGVGGYWKATVSPLALAYLPTGQTISFKGADNPKKIKSTKRAKGYVKYIWYEELDEFTPDEITTINQSLIRGGDEFFVFYSYNPPRLADNWVNLEAGKPRADRLTHHSDYRDVPPAWLGEPFIAEAEHMRINNEIGYRHTYLGEIVGGEGQVFSEFRNEPNGYITRQWTHVIKPIELPVSWKRYKVLDWGYAKPFSVGWYAVDYDGRLYRYRELYGCTGEPDVGIKWTVDQLAQEIRKIEQERDTEYLKGGNRIHGFADPAIFTKNGGESMAEIFERNQVYFDPADNSRIAGKMQVHYRFAFDADGRPMLYVFNTCKGFIRTIPMLTYSDRDPEDVDTKLEDHIYDETRYMCQMNPIAPRKNTLAPKPQYNPLDSGSKDDRYGFMRT